LEGTRDVRLVYLLLSRRSCITHPNLKADEVATPHRQDQSTATAPCWTEHDVLAVSPSPRRGHGMDLDGRRRGAGARARRATRSRPVGVDRRCPPGDTLIDGGGGERRLPAVRHGNTPHAVAAGVRCGMDRRGDSAHACQHDSLC